MPELDLLREFLSTTNLPANEIAVRQARVRADVLGSAGLSSPNFSRLNVADLSRLVLATDAAFFEGRLSAALRGQNSRLGFRLSSRMTRVGGKTSRWRRNGKPDDFEIAISSTLLFQSFRDDESHVIGREIIVNGCVCSDRLDALQRVAEHEIVHLAEMLAWDGSSCSQPRFIGIAARIFGHTGTKHQLVNQRERALKLAGIKLGDAVKFRFDGREYTGFVNRITKRATVLVEDARGERYSNGKNYLKFYVPVTALTRLGG